MPQIELKGKVSLDGSGFDRTLAGMQRGVSRWAGGIKNMLAGAFSAAAIASATKTVVDMVGRIKDLSEQSRLTTDEVQLLDHALQQSGMEFENAAQSITKLAGARREAVEGNKELRATFERYGITLANLNDPSIRTYDLLLKMSEAMRGKNLTDREQTEIADLLGVKSAKLLTTLQDLSAIKPPELVSQEQIDRIDKAEKGWRRIWNFIKVKGAEQLEKIGILYGIGGPDIGEMEELAKGADVPITKAEIEAANKAKRERLGLKEKSKAEGLFTVDKDAAIKDTVRETMRAVRSDPLQLSEFQRIGAFAGETTNRALRVSEQQLRELKGIRTNTSPSQGGGDIF